MSPVQPNVVSLDQHRAPAPTKAERFRALLASPQLEFIMEAHNGLSAKIVYITGHWLDVNDAFDLARGRNVL